VAKYNPDSDEAGDTTSTCSIQSPPGFCPETGSLQVSGIMFSFLAVSITGLQLGFGVNCVRAGENKVHNRPCRIFDPDKIPRFYKLVAVGVSPGGRAPYQTPAFTFPWDWGFPLGRPWRSTGCE
jgi:hypothetical protein